MMPGSLSIVPIFATPLAVVTLPIAPETTQVVSQLLARRAAADPTALAADPLCYQGGEDLLEWEEEPVQHLCGEILRGVWSTVAAVTTLDHAQLQSLSLQARGGYTIVRPDGCVPATNHSLTAWCAIYCLQAPPPAAERADSGVVRFYESRLRTAFSDATNSALRMPFSTGHYAWRAVPGQLVVFPGALTYEIPLIRSVGPLTLITLRSRFLGPGQEGWQRW